jgi:hypothetical protein
MRRFAKLLIGPALIDEFGDPEDSQDWKFLAGLSAYHVAAPGICGGTVARPTRGNRGRASVAFTSTSASRESSSGGASRTLFAPAVTLQPAGAVNVAPFAVVIGVSAASGGPAIGLPSPLVGWPMAPSEKQMTRASRRIPTPRIPTQRIPLAPHSPRSVRRSLAGADDVGETFRHDESDYTQLRRARR